MARTIITEVTKFFYGKGHQSPTWEVWSGGKDRIKVIRLIRAIEEEEAKGKSWIAPGQAIALAKKEGLEVTQEQIKELIEIHKEWFRNRAHKPWREKYLLYISVLPRGTGRTTPPGGKFTPDTPITLTAIPRHDYIFDRWSGDYVGTDNPITITMDSDKGIIAHFKKVGGPP